MKVKMLVRSGLLVGTSVASVIGFSGMAAADVSISNTGPWSNNQVSAFVTDHFRQTSNNNVSVSNSNHQTATTGNAFVGGNTGVKHVKLAKLLRGCETWQPMTWQPWSNKHNDCLRSLVACHGGGNTFGGSASTGNASNWNDTHANVAVTNESGNNWGSNWGGSSIGNDGASISDTGPWSNNSIRANVRMNTTVTNNNTVRVSNSNNQVATTGSATVAGNTVGGSASTGDATNANSTEANVSVVNNTPTPMSFSGSGMGGSAFIDNTGPGSNNTISAHVTDNTTLTNNNNVSLTNTNHQTARTGNATVAGNTFGGDASSGDASNWNSTDLQVAIVNN